MSFKENTYQQISFADSFSGLTAREQKALENSWAKVFTDEIFPAIDEQRFSVLYSNKAPRPNTPVNVVVSALIIKELFDYSDDEMIENLMLDFWIQYALHTTSFEEQPLSDMTLSQWQMYLILSPVCFILKILTNGRHTMGPQFIEELRQKYIKNPPEGMTAKLVKIFFL